MFNEKLRNTKSYSQREKERKNGIKKRKKEGNILINGTFALHKMNTLSFHL